MHPAVTPARTAVGTLAIIALLTAFGALMFLGLASFETFVRLQRDRDTRYRASMSLVGLQALLAHMSDAEAGQLGFLITGRAEYLDPYEEGHMAITFDTVALSHSATNDSVLAIGLAAVQPLIAGKLELMDSTLQLFQSGRRQEALAQVTSGRGKQLMDSVRLELSRTAIWLRDELDMRSERVATGWRRAKLSLLVSGAFALATFATACLVILMQFRARLRAERAAQAREHQMFQMLEAMPVGVFVIDDQGRPYYTNQRSRDILGKDPDRAVSMVDLPATYQAYRMGTDELYPGDDQPIARALRGEHVNARDIEIRRPERVIPLEVWGAPVYDDHGQITHAIAAFGDMTDREKARRELETVIKELETFSYSVSHDLRSPLRAIAGFSRILEQEHGPSLNEDAHRLLGIIRANSQRMGRLIDDLLAFARFGRQEMRHDRVDMERLVHAALEDLRHAGEDGAATITIGTLPAVRGDVGLLRQVWMNLLGNALKYSRKTAAPRIAVDAEMRGSQVEYRIRDNGVGFDMAYADKLFGVFQRLHRPEEFEGTGVGLATVQRIVHRHGGRVWADAQPGHGATFFFTLPAED